MPSKYFQQIVKPLRFSGGIYMYSSTYLSFTNSMKSYSPAAHFKALPSLVNLLVEGHVKEVG